MEELDLHPDLRDEAPVIHREPTVKLTAFNWLDKISGSRNFNFVQVQFKNTRNSFYDNYLHLDLHPGDMVAVEAAQGHDIGTVLMTGRLVGLQMKKANLHHDFEVKRIFRKAHKSDLDKYKEAKSREHDTMIQARRIAEEMGLNMKIGDVEYQGDGGKAIFYYIADERVDFRKLIRVFADTFKVRIEMKQIGARQEAGRIGGIGPCGRPLCCATWLSHFVSVGTAAARFQDLSMNPQKLAGMCDKLKCCLNYEVDEYMEAQRKLPPKEAVLSTTEQDYYYFKADILAHKVTYSTEKNQPVNTVTIDARRAFEVIAMNKEGVKPEALNDKEDEAPVETGFFDLTDQDSLTRFDKSKKKKKKKKPETRQGEQGGGQRQGNGEKKNERRRQPKEGAQPKQSKEEAQHKPQPKGEQKQPKEGGQPKQNREQQPKQPKGDQQAKHSRQGGNRDHRHHRRRDNNGKGGGRSPEGQGGTTE